LPTPGFARTPDRRSALQIKGFRFAWMLRHLPMKYHRALLGLGAHLERSLSRKGVIGILSSVTLVLFSVVVVAQQQSNPSQEKSGPTSRGMMSGGMMNQMMEQHQGMFQLMSKMTQSMTAIDSEKDPVKLKALLAEHRALMDQMRSKMTEQGSMMQYAMGQMKNCPGMGDAKKSASK